jgi:hypothetical protein
MAGDFAGAWASFKSGWSAGISGSVDVTNKYQESAYDFDGNFKEGSEH